MNELDKLLHPSTSRDKEAFAYWIEVAKQFLERYDIELGLANAYGGHLAILLERAYLKGKQDTDIRTLETVAALLNGDDNQVEVVRGYVRNKLSMYRDRQEGDT